MRRSLVGRGFALWAECRAEFEEYRLGAYLRAEETCRGAMLNRRGKAAGIDPYSLFLGNSARALAYASEELADYWRNVEPRMTYAAFEAQWHEPE